MGRSKPRTNKRPPPKALPQPVSPLAPPPPASSAQSPPPPLQPTPTDLTSALHTWSTSALGRLDALPKLTQSQLSAIAGAAAGVGDGQQGSLPIDLPASLAALFEAKLTLDREKAKLMRMQKELKGYREGVAAVSAGKGKEIAEECTCGRQHSPVYEEYSDEECYNCECDCHYVECDHEHEEACDCEEDYEHTCGPVTIPNPYLQKDSSNQLSYQQALEAYRDERDNAARGLDEIGGMFKAAGWEPEPQRPQRPLTEDPERLDEAVRELFNWIKAVVWTIEQAAIVAGRRRT